MRAKVRDSSTAVKEYKLITLVVTDYIAVDLSRDLIC